MSTRSDFRKKVKDRMFFKCTGEPPHRGDGPLPHHVLCEGCVLEAFIEELIAIDHKSEVAREPQ